MPPKSTAAAARPGAQQQQGIAAWLTNNLPQIAIMVFAVYWLWGQFGPVNPGPYLDLAAKIRRGEAVLVDIREPGEWAGGVAEPAYLLSMSSKGSPKWAKLLEAHKDKEIVLYCRSGTRAGIMASQLRGQGYKAVNGGHINGWSKSGLPVRQPRQDELRG